MFSCVVGFTHESKGVCFSGRVIFSLYKDIICKCGKGIIDRALRLAELKFRNAIFPPRDVTESDLRLINNLL
jgi:hypothetical protein